MGLTIRKMPLRSLCRFKMAILSEGGICIGEEYCFLPVGHDGPHRGGHGQLVVNHDELWREPRK